MSARGRVSPARLEAHVRALAEDFVPRDFRHPANLERAAAYIRGQLGRTGGRVSVQPVQGLIGLYSNVIAAYGPETDERIVVGAHYDADGPLPAADDNASGVAGLIELGGLLGAAPPPLRVELVAFTLEERPFFRTRNMGSAVHARALRAQGVRVRAMIALEMIGYFTDAPGSQRFPLGLLRAFYPSRGNFITVVGRLGERRLAGRIKHAMRGASPLPVHALNAPRWVPGIAFSDHLSYWDAGYPAVMVTDTAFFRNPHYHTAGDTPATLDYARMADVVHGVHAAVLQLA